MTRSEEIGRGIFAAWRFLLFDHDAHKFVAPTGRGVLLSFSALLVVLPLYALTAYIIGLDPNAANFARIPIWLLTAGYLITWPLYALLMFHLLQAVDRGQYYIYFMPIYNWGRMIGLFVQLPTQLLISFQVLPNTWQNPALILTAIIVLSYKTFIARRTTGCSIFHAIIFVSLDALMVLMVEWSMRDAFAV